MSPPQKKYTCLNNPLEFWTALKIPPAVLAAPPPPQHPQGGSRLLHLPTELLLAIFEQTAAQNPDPLDQLALSLTCKGLLSVAATFSTSKSKSKAPSLLPGGGIPVPSIPHHAPLEPPCPAIARLQSILAGLPTPTPAPRVQVLHNRNRLARQRGIRYYFGTCLRSDLSPVPAHGRDEDTHPRNLEYCPACCHMRPRGIRFWQRRFAGDRHLHALQVAPITTTLKVRLVIELWERKAHIDCPECWAKAVLLEPSLPRPLPQLTNFDSLNLRDGRNSIGYYDFAYLAQSFIGRW
ncbi:hypothetical protein PG991_003447 [Apiospora marii]|uniref:F-box domain-containing protein n=2 Tax=Apiospora marii TaxID=335849 RepID=A0ABR1S3M3_9PEZI